MEMYLKVKIECEERLVRALEGLAEFVGARPCAEGCAEKTKKEAKLEEKTADSKDEKSDFDTFVDAMVDEVVTAPIEAAAKEAAKEAAAKEASVPTVEPAYTFPEIQRACAKLVQEGKREELAKLIKSFDLQSLPDLKEEQYDAFVLLLREIGGTI